MMVSQKKFFLALVGTIFFTTGSQIPWVNESQAARTEYGKICPEYLWMITSISLYTEKPDPNRDDCNPEERITFIEEVLEKSHDPARLRDIALMVAAWKGHLDVLEYLLDNGACVECRQGATGYTSLMLAVKRGNIGEVELLLHHGADIHVSGIDGESPISLSIKYRYDKVHRILKFIDMERKSRKLLLWEWNNSSP